MTMPPRLSPEQLMLMKLDEISKRLEDLVSMGILITKTIPVETTWIALAEGDWKSCDIYNDGDADIYLRIDVNFPSPHPFSSGEAPLKKDDHISIDMKGRRWENIERGEKGSPSIWAICASGTASVRILKFV